MFCSAEINLKSTMSMFFLAEINLKFTMIMFFFCRDKLEKFKKVLSFVGTLDDLQVSNLKSNSRRFFVLYAYCMLRSSV